ncbi:MAG: hypothetical protein ACRD8W_13545 [Nitrososphaeraceae archaeon]
MSCNTGKLTKNKIILLSLLGIGLTVGIYFVFSTTNNPAIAAAVPALAAFAICPVMCAVMGGLMWVISRSSKSKGKEQKSPLKDEGMSWSGNILGQATDNSLQNQESTTNSKLLPKFNKNRVLHITDDIAVLSSQNLEEQKPTTRNRLSNS